MQNILNLFFRNLVFRSIRMILMFMLVMMGKVLGGIGASLTTAAIYVAAGVFTLTYSGMPSLIPYEVLPWFFVFSVLFILMVGSGMHLNLSIERDS